MKETATKFKRAFLKEYYHIEVYREMELTKNGYYKEAIQKCRSFYNSNDIVGYKKAKSELPAVAFCGKFENGHSIKDLVSYNQLMIIDIDGLTQEETIQTKKVLSEDKYIMALWLSPSGLGLKGLIKIESKPETHKYYFESLKNYLFDRYSVILDNSGSDLSRLCYVSWDEELYLNEKSEIYSDDSAINRDEIIRSVSKSIKKNQQEIELENPLRYSEDLNLPTDRILIKRILKYLVKREISITSTYEEWVKAALSISNSFTYELGEKYFIELCRLDGKNHDEVKSKNLLRKIYNNHSDDKKNKLTFSTLVFMAQEKGFIYKKKQ